MSSESQANLVARCRNGEARAWDELFELYYASTGRFVFQLSSDLTREDAEEICQETFLSVIHCLKSFRGGCQLQTWIFRIASNKARDYRERQHAAKRGGGKSAVSLQAKDEETGLSLDPPDNVPGPDKVLLNSERMEQVSNSLSKLGEPCREIIELRYFGDLSYEEISAELNLNPKTVSSRLSKCVDRLGTIMKAVFSGEDSEVFPVK
jgi:RNA polymerase sigma-70 factor, ECF subfamily